MNSPIQGAPVQDMPSSNSTSMLEISNALHEANGRPSLYQQLELDAVMPDCRRHAWMIRRSSIGNEAAHPICYVRFVQPASKVSSNSSEGLTATVQEYYDKVERQLTQLSNEDSSPPTVEKGAIDTALAVVSELKRYQIAPPELSWHGGDAVVMLWSLAETTYAITITEGELGYVVRRNRRRVKLVDSIALSTFSVPQGLVNAGPA